VDYHHRSVDASVANAGSHAYLGGNAAALPLESKIRDRVASNTDPLPFGGRSGVGSGGTVPSSYLPAHKPSVDGSGSGNAGMGLLSSQIAGSNMFSSNRADIGMSRALVLSQYGGVPAAATQQDGSSEAPVAGTGSAGVGRSHTMTAMPLPPPPFSVHQRGMPMGQHTTSK
jgi:hypothetical protein